MPCIMVCGTTSSAGKSVLVAAICRILARRGYDVAPFKAQNMSLNSYITKNGREIAIAQAYQAFAAGTDPDERMNPVLLKPKGNFVSQLVVMGKAVCDVDSRSFYRDRDLRRRLEKVVLEAYRSLEEEYEYVIIEGAGGMAEINLYPFDIPNIYVARSLKPSIVVVGDIDRGGVFASLYGTYHLLPDDVKGLICGFVINRMRGAEELLKPGIEELERLCGVPVLGVLPYLNTHLPSEDSLNVEEWRESGPIAVVRLPRMSNFTDFEMMREFVTFVPLNGSVSEYDVVILPGSKDTIADLRELKSSRVGEELKRLVGRKLVIGVCGGYQMLGRELHDSGVEHGNVRVKGLGFLDAITEFRKYEKITRQIERRVNGKGAVLERIKGEKVWGYEIHKGVTIAAQPIFEDEGCVSDDGMCWGTYLHGLFWNDNVLGALGEYLGVKFRQKRNWADVLADVVEERLNLDVILSQSQR